MKKYIVFAIFLIFSSQSFAQADTVQKIVAGRTNSPEQQQKPYVIMISVDGFRHDYAQKYNASCLLSLQQNGVRARYMMPSYPSLTFPNHYTLVTGLYPSHHGLVDNQFYDPALGEKYSMKTAKTVTDQRWYGGLPLWVLAEQQQLLTASFYWVGSEAPVQGVRPTYWYTYNEKIPIEKRIQTVVDWLQLPAERRPHFISFYFPEVDHDGHVYGPEHPQTAHTVRWVDSVLCRLTEAVQKTGLEVNYVFVADHGMTAVDTAHPLRVPVVDSSKAVVVPGGELVQVYVKQPADIPTLYKQLKAGARDYSVVLKNEMPERLHYGAKDDTFNRIGDILLIPDWPYTFVPAGAKPKAGAHGYDPYKVKDMRTVFYAWGPAFKKGKTVGKIKNTDVYPVVANLLGLPYNHQIDGNKKLAKKILIKR